MSTITTTKPLIYINKGSAKTTSAAVAKFFGKQHFQVLRDIRNLISQVDTKFRLYNFVETQIERQTPTGGIAKDTVYEITRDGFTLLAMGFTGAKALQWKIKYIEAFNKMEAQLSKTPQPTYHHPRGRLTPTILWHAFSEISELLEDVGRAALGNATADIIIDKLLATNKVIKTYEHKLEDLVLPYEYNDRFELVTSRVRQSNRWFLERITNPVEA